MRNTIVRKIIYNFLFILFILVVGMKATYAATTVYVSNSGESNGNGDSNSPVKTINEALNKINDEGVIVIKDNLKITEKIEITGNKKITIKSDGSTAKTLTFATPTDGSDGDWGFRINNKATLTVENITIEGTETGTAYPKNSLFLIESGNLIINQGTTIQNHKSGWVGGAIRTTSNSKITMNGGIIKGNSAPDSGGAMSLISSSFTMNGGEISNNRTTNGPGGAIATENGSIIILNGGTIKENKSQGNGGAISLVNSNLTISDGFTINGNESKINGGGIYLYSESGNNTITINGGTIEGNKAETNGGGIWIEKSKLIGNGGKITNNSTTTNPSTKSSDDYRGGGIFAHNGAKIELNGIDITSNTSVRGGGIYLHNNSELLMTTGSINNNIATANAGGLYIGASGDSTASATISGGEIRNNQNTGTDTDTTENFVSDTEFSAGAIYVAENCTLKLTNVVIYDNNIDQSKFIGNRSTDESMMAGGIGLCPNANFYFYINDGGAIYNNLANGQGADILLVTSSTKLPFNTAKMFASYLALGNGINHWTDINGKFIEAGEFNITGEDKFISLISHLNNDDISEAQKVANLFISGNQTNAIYGGGAIMCNGTLEIGTKSELDDLGGLEVTKEIKGDIDPETSFNFKVTLDDKTINGTYGDMEFKDGVATFTLKHGERKIAINLPKGIKYTVEETEGEKYNVEYVGETGTITNGGLKRTEVENKIDVDTKAESKNPNTSAFSPIILIIVSLLIIGILLYFNKKRIFFK